MTARLPRLSKMQTIRGLCLAAGVLALAACTHRTTAWSPIEAPKKNTVFWAEYHHPVHFAGSSANLDKAETDALARFLDRVGQGEGVSVILAAGSEHASALAKRRETSLARYLIDRGYAVSRIPGKSSYTTRADSVRVTVGRYIVKPPTCPDWSKDPTGDPFNQPTSNFRCATETNLGLMVANPEALIRGRTLGPADSEAVSVGIKAYRKDAVKKPTATSAKELSGGGGK